MKQTRTAVAGLEYRQKISRFFMAPMCARGVVLAVPNKPLAWDGNPESQPPSEN
jgi:hypothetical protein